MMMEVGRTEAEEQEQLRRQIHNFENDPSVLLSSASSLSSSASGNTQNCISPLFLKASQPSQVSTEDKLALVKSHLSEEAKALMEELLKQGYSKEEVMDLFLRCANNLDMITSDALFQRKVRFSDEPPDAYLYEGRDVWTMITKEEVKRRIPYMSSSSKSVTFASFFGLVMEVTREIGLTNREILDVIRFRLGGDYARQFDALRADGWKLQDIVDHFLLKDEEGRVDAMRRAKIKAQARIDAELNLRRARAKELWGVQMMYQLSREQGLLLVMQTVREGSPAWNSGLR